MDPGLTAEPYKIADKTSFAYVSARDRWPVILTQALDDVFKHTQKSEDKEHRQGGRKIIEKIAKLKYEVQHDRTMTPLEDDGQDDIRGYNDELEFLGNPKWFQAPWLYAECYLYRRLHTFFSRSETWRNHDVFRVQKNTTLRSSLAAVLELAEKYRQIVSALENPEKLPSGEETAEKEKLLFIEMCEICLWGNATDLSLLTSLTFEDIQKLQGSEARKKSEENILTNDLPRVYDTLQKQKDGGIVGRIDIVLDNSGFELFVDLILAGYLLAAGLASEVVFHPKNLSWFVSDVLPGDFEDLINVLRDPVAYFAVPENGDFLDGEGQEPILLTGPESSDLGFVASHWSDLRAAGKISLRTDHFWTTAASYWRLPTAAPELFQELKQSDLVIFKGDLNYRKLTADASWDPTTKFEAAIGALGKPGSGIRVLALRTCKADVVVGIEPGKDEELRAAGGEEDGEKRKWAWSGKWAVIQFWDGKS